MKKANLIIIVLLGVIIALGTAIFLQKSGVTEQTLSEEQPVTPPQTEVKQPIVHYPVPRPPLRESSAEATDPADNAEQTAVEKPASPGPELAAMSLSEALEQLLGEHQVVEWLLMDSLIQRLVTTIDNLPGKTLNRAHFPVIPPEGKFIVSGTEEAPQTSPRNQKRYAPYTDFLVTLNQELAISIYVFYYEEFQRAYEKLGYQNAYFNDRLVFVLEHLLKTPNPPDPIQLDQPAVLYTYADPRLENLSAGQKLLLRVGREQRTRILEVLANYHQELTTLHPEDAPEPPAQPTESPLPEAPPEEESSAF